ncbi:ABC transporter ATP-binding protein [Rhodohalobacter mucosus]|uniref:Sulfate ABC transporter ATP-binding protein n=1 Tax=Rhodohalobacter mucosus TaxID=2079485 RepID=A0A316TNX0_9BACT|nr:ABC transporter ATP-binding protein [Rhodohalobacter mucosus]PWN05478.1 sulfate ABC transporter ATP-binding protein [Rhodohalobacter mucosus]
MMIEARGISKSYGNEKVLQDVSFSLSENETLSVLGRSGSGKTTLLKIFAGLTQEYTGTIQLNGQAIDNLKPSERGMVYLYQEPLLFPHLTVSENIGFGLRIQGYDDKTIRIKTGEMIERLHIQGQEEKYPHQLSGGQKQRVAFGRAFIIHPRVLLLDEPFGSLDPETRSEMQQLFVEISKSEKITTMFVTHDLKEALITGTRFGMMINGSLNVYDNHDDFINDAQTGVQDELTFWKNLMR